MARGQRQRQRRSGFFRDFGRTRGWLVALGGLGGVGLVSGRFGCAGPGARGLRNQWFVVFGASLWVLLGAAQSVETGQTRTLPKLGFGTGLAV